jgi:hypothetical protein
MPLQPRFGGLGQSEAVVHGCVQCGPFELKLKQSIDWQSEFCWQGAPKVPGPPASHDPS